MATPAPRRFYKMTGSGNDFVVFESGGGPFGDLESPGPIRSVCARGTGVGADGAVFLESAGKDTVRMRYYNADGSRATLCGNASLCSARLAVELGLVSPDFTIDTDAGRLAARIHGGLPEIDLAPVEQVDPDRAGLGKLAAETRLGFALVGVPHVVVQVPDLERIDIEGRGAQLRRHASLADGANVNFVANPGGRWSYRTYERGVEGETLACGTGAVATAILLATWGESGPNTVLTTRSGQPLTVTLRQNGGQWFPSLKGEGRIVFEGTLRDIA